MEVACSTRNTPRPQQPVLARLRGTDASQIVEFAVTLPLLMVFLIGITDFGGAIKKGDTDLTGVIGQIPFTDPRYLNDPRNYKKDFRSDIYSLGVIFWVGFVF